jgi:hypothetical protein
MIVLNADVIAGELSIGGEYDVPFELYAVNTFPCTGLFT